MIPILILCVFLIMLASLAGVFFLWKRAGDFISRNMIYLVAFSTGLFLVVIWHLIEETLEFSNGFTAFICIASGFVFFHILEYLMPDIHRHHSSSKKHEKASRALGQRVLIGDALHNIADGLLLAPAFVIDVRLGIATAVGVFLHEFLQEISEYFLLREAGYTAGQALLRNFLVSSTVIIGIVASATIAQSEELIGPILGIAAGAFLYIVLHDLAPRIANTKRPFIKLFLCLAAGSIIFYLLTSIVHE